jgi:hypothetical protein
MEGNAGGLGDLLECADLVDEEQGEFFGLNSEVGPAEVGLIDEAGVGAEVDFGVLASADASFHGCDGAGVTAAGNVG